MRNRIQSLLRSLLAGLVACAVWFSLAPRPAHAEWDLARIGEVKQAAETAYDDGEYAEAARQYIELRRLLKNALEADEVPDDMVDSARLALVASTYQLGRTNQLSSNCSGALKVYEELVELLDDDASGIDDAAMRARATARIAESHACLAGEKTEAGELEAAADALDTSRAALSRLDTVTPALSADEQADIETLETDVSTVIEEQESAAVEALMKSADRVASAGACERLDALLALGAKRFATARDWSDAESLKAECRGTTQRDESAEDEDETRSDPPPPSDVAAGEGPPWWPGFVVTGVGVVTLAGGAVADGLLASDIDAHERRIDDCAAGDAAACATARSERSDIESQQDVVLALYVTGGIVTAGGIAYVVITAIARSDTDATPPAGELSVAPTLDGGVMSTWRWRF